MSRTFGRGCFPGHGTERFDIILCPIGGQRVLLGTDTLCLCDSCCPHAAECKNHESQESCYLLAGGSLLPWRTFAAVLATCHSFPFLGTQSSPSPHFLQLRGGPGPSRHVRVKPLASKSMAHPSLSEPRLLLVGFCF